MKYLLFIIFSICVFTSCSFYKNYNQNSKNYSTIKTIINNKDNDPNPTIKLYINDCKRTIINEIQSLNIDSVKKKSICDSILSIPFIISNSMNNMKYKNAIFYAFYYDYKPKNYTFLKTKVRYNNSITLNYKYIHTSGYNYCIYHELYHYIDKLMGDNNQYYSGKINFRKYIDSNIYDRTYLTQKISSLIYFNNINSDNKIQIDPNNYILMNYISYDIYSLLDYASSNEEMFVRYNQLKRCMVEYNIINNVSVKITKKDILTFLSKYNFYEAYFKVNNTPDYFYFIVLMNLDKIELLEKQLY